LQDLSRIREQEARSLLEAGFYDGAFYVAGYAVECALKACIAKNVPRHHFPDLETVRESYSHELDKLLGIAGLRDALKSDMSSNKALRDNWNSVSKSWSAESRYERHGRAEAQDLLAAATARRTGVLPWIRRRW